MTHPQNLVHASSGIALPMGIMEIRRLLPHRYPFLLVDRITELEIGERAVGIKNVTANEPLFQGHFPDRPIFPGVLVLEALAQTAAVLVCLTFNISGETSDIYFMSIDKAKFRKPVVPGDTLEMHVRVLRSHREVQKFAGETRVDGIVVAECEFTAMFRDKAAR